MYSKIELNVFAITHLLPSEERSTLRREAQAQPLTATQEEEEREDENIVNKLTTNTYINTFIFICFNDLKY